MKNELIIMTFAIKEGAMNARQALEIMRHKQLFGLENAVTVTRDRAGKVAIFQQRISPTDVHNPYGQISGILADAIFVLPPEEGLQKLVDAGLDEGFLREVRSALDPDSSALLSYIPQDSLVDTQRMIDTLKQFRGTLRYATVTAEVEEAILG